MTCPSGGAGAGRASSDGLIGKSRNVHIAEERDHVIGVDAHARTHTCAIVDISPGACLATETFPATAIAIGRAIAWLGQEHERERARRRRGTSSYSAG